MKYFSIIYSNLNKLITKSLIKDSFSKQTLTILTIVFITALATFLALTENILATGKITQIDNQLTNALFHYRNPEIAKLFYGITLFGSAITVLIFAALFSIYCLIKKHYQYLCILVALSGTKITVSLLKTFIDRSRPSEEIAYYIEKSMSFPSGHASISVAFYGYLAYFILRRTASSKIRTYIIATCTTIIILIGFSRIYLGEHYLSDVLGGYLIGLLWLIIAIILTEITMKINYAHFPKNAIDK